MIVGYPGRSYRVAPIVVVCSVLAALVLQFGVALPVSAATGTFQQYTYSGSTGSRPYSVYTPVGYTTATRVPLVVMLHGCWQNPIDFAAGTGMNDLADTKQFVVAYPRQLAAYESNFCWHFWDPASQSRGSGEAAIVAGITQTVMADTAHWNIDSQRVYVAGFSAGAAMAVIMGATYPDLYAAIGVSAGLEYKAATDAGAVGWARQHGGADPVAQGKLAYSAMGANARVLPVIVFHGTADSIVAPINGDQVVQQWMQTDHLASSNSYNPSFTNPSVSTPGSVPGGRAYTIRRWNDAGGTEVQEYWTITGMGHAWSGGSSAGTYTDPTGPNESQNVYAFFIAHPLSRVDASLTVSGLSDATAGTAQTMTVSAGDASGAVMTGYRGTVTFSSTDGRASLPADYTFVPEDYGVHSFTGGVTLRSAGTQTVTAADRATTTVTGSQTVTVTPGTLDRIALTPSSATLVAGGSQSYTATGVDQYGNSLVDVTAGTAFSVAPDGSCASARCTATVAGAHTVKGTYSGMTATASLNVIAAAASQLSLTAPSSAKASQSFRVTVTVRDQYGNVATGYRGTVRFTSSDPVASLGQMPAPYSFSSADAGTRNFTVTLLTVGNQTVTVTDQANSSLTDTKTVAVSLL
jgi:poly(hydroxyalkanoate) depolymerase family esterase